MRWALESSDDTENGISFVYGRNIYGILHFKLKVVYFLLVICFRVNASVCNFSNYFLCMPSQNLTKTSILSKNVTFYKC